MRNITFTGKAWADFIEMIFILYPVNIITKIKQLQTISFHCVIDFIELRLVGHNNSYFNAF